MEARELRIGNLVKSTTHNTYYRVTLIEDDYDYSKTEPIPLTEGWLLRFGFEKNYKFGLYYKGGHAIDIHREGNAEFYTGEYGGWFVFVEYVHELQNLYFALTGEELKLQDND
jgi:hypothetical protein